MNERKVYLGDSVYADMDEFDAMILTTENGMGPSNRIVLEPEVFNALQQWLYRIRQARHRCEDHVPCPNCGGQECHGECRE